MAFSKARRLGDLITANAEQFITSAHITDTAITGSDIHSTFDLTGKTVTVATASAGDNDTSAASTAFVQQEIASLVDSAPGTLNTLNELAAALGDDANFSTTVTNSIATKLPLAGGTLTGALTAPQLTVDNVGINGDTITFTGSSASAFMQTSTNVFQIGTSTNDRIDILANNAVRATILGDGKVGINEDAPQQTLSVGVTSGSLSGISLTLNDTDLAAFLTSSSTGEVRIGGVYTNYFPTFYSNNSEAMRIDTSGNVGIGTTSPDSPLHLESTGATTLRIRTSSSSSEPQMIMIDGAGDYFAMQKVDRGMTFKPQGAEAMRITTGGKVFIGSSNDVAYGGLGDLVFQQSADDLGIGIIDDNETNTLKLINNGTVSKIEQNGAIPIQIKNANGVLAEFKTYAVPKMNFHYANNNIYQVSTTADEESSGQGVMILKQQISVSAGSKIIVWYDTGQILNNNQGGNGSANSNPHIAVYVSSNGTAPSNRGDAHMINSQTNHYWYPAGSQGSARLKMNGMGATGTISTAGTYYIYVYGGSYNSGSYTFNYQNSSSNTRGCNIIWAEVMA